MEKKSKSFEELSAYIDELGLKHAKEDSDEMGFLYEMRVFHALLLFAIDEGYNPKKYDLNAKISNWTYHKMIRVSERLQKDYDKKLLPEKIAILYKKLMTEWWPLCDFD